MRQPRYTYRRSSFFGNFPPGVKWLLIINTAMFLITSLFARQFGDDFRLLALAPVAVVKHFAIWQLVTYLFLHGGITHLLFNMLALWMFGTPLESDWGTRRVPEILLHLRHRRGHLRCGDECRDGQLADQHHRRVGRDLRAAAGVRRLLSGPDGADGLPVPDQGQVHGHDLCGHRTYLSLGVNNGVSNIAHLGGMVVGLLYLKIEAAEVETEAAGLARGLPPVETAARQEEVPGLHAQARRPRALGQLSNHWVN